MTNRVYYSFTMSTGAMQEPAAPAHFVRVCAGSITGPGFPSKSSPRTRGPITTGVCGLGWSSHTALKLRGLGVWVPAFAGTTRKGSVGTLARGAGDCNRPINAFLTLTAVTKWLRAEPVWGTAEAHLTLEIPWQPSKSHAEIRACDSGRPDPAIAPRMGFSRRKARRSAGI